MRVGDDASISPAGDMIAFAVSMGLVMLALTVIGSDMNADDPRESGLKASDLESASTWRGFDRDRNGRIEYESMADIDNVSYELPIEGYVNVTIRSRTFEYSFHFMDGRLIENETGFVVEETLRHSVMVSVETSNETIPCIMIVSAGEVVT